MCSIFLRAIGLDGCLGARPDSDAVKLSFIRVAASSHLPTRGLRDVIEIVALGVTLASGERFTHLLGYFIRLRLPAS